MLNYSQVTLALDEITHFPSVNIPICKTLLPYKSISFVETVVFINIK